MYNTKIVAYFFTLVKKNSFNIYNELRKLQHFKFFLIVLYDLL